jgi:Na+/proline symporter/signal transduction histidine kinase
MPGPWAISIVAVAYVGLLFAIARFGERHAARLRTGVWEPLIYASSLAVYCASWTFYGSIAHAAWSGLGFALTYIGPILTLLLGYPVLQKIVRTAKANNATSIADFIGARYGKSQSVAALVTVVAVIGLVPYVALQLQAVSVTFDLSSSNGQVLHTPGRAAAASSPLWRDTAFYVTLLMAVFAVLFGLNRVQSNERNPGMMTAIAFESLVKLGAFLALGLFVTFGLFGGPAQLGERVSALPHFVAAMTVPHAYPHWITITFLAGVAFICLPRQFHVAVVENVRPASLRVAAWAFPLYLVAFALFVPVIAAGGLLTLPRFTLAESFPLLLPMRNGQPLLALAVFIGGLSAATAMIIVEVVALSTMICNEIVMPLLSRRAALGKGASANMPKLVLRTRWLAAFGVLLAAYGYYATTSARYSLASIGLISFVAVAQFAPALLAGLYWRGAHRHGAVAGIVGGCIVWAYAMLLPSLPSPGAAASAGVEAAGRLPQILPALDPFTTMVAWSLLVNAALLVGVSLLARRNESDRAQAELFVSGGLPVGQSDPTTPIHAGTYDELRRLAERVVGAEQAARAFAEPAERYNEKDLAALTERLLSGAVGAASAHIMVTAVLRTHRNHFGTRRSILTDASEAILFNHDLLRATLENVTQGIGMFDAHGKLAAWNRRLLEMLNIPEQHAWVGAPLTLVLGDCSKLGLDPASAPGSEAARRSLAAQTCQHRLADGRVFELQVNPIHAGGFVLVCTDVSEQMQTLEALRNSDLQIREANELLEQRVVERTRELTLLNEQLAAAKRAAEAANVGKTRFFAAASHDLLQPLHVARILTGALSERYGAARGSTLKQLERALNSVDDLLQTLLDISKLDTGAVQPQLQPVELQKVLTGVCASFQPIAAQRGLQLRMARSRAVVSTDVALLRRILQNFLSNALRYTRRGKVLVGCRRRAGRVLIEVWDTGIGIPGSQIDAIFEEFRRGAQNDPETPPGLGLGLAIVDRIARMLQHPVQVRSWPGRGSVFSISLPVSTEAPLAQLPGSDAQPRASLAHKVVLCVDNDPAVLVAMRTLLQGWSCEVVTATHVADARSQLEKLGTLPDIVLMDYHLESDLTGLAALDSLSAHAGRRLPAILVTANYTEVVRQEADARGYPVLNKPVRPGALRALMAQMLSRETRSRSLAS